VKRTLMMNVKDNVATALENLDAGTLTRVILPSQEKLKEVASNQAVPFGHKIAIIGIKKGDKVIKYGQE